MVKYGLTGIELLKLMNNSVWDLKFTEEKKIFILEKIGDYEFRMVEGSDEQLQLEALLAQFALLGVK